MQINVIDYFEQGALLTCRDKLAVKDQIREYTFGEIERFAKNCAALILKRSSAANQPVPVFLPKSGQNIIADLGVLYSANAYANLDIKAPQGHASKPPPRGHHHLRRPCRRAPRPRHPRRKAALDRRSDDPGSLL